MARFARSIPRLLVWQSLRALSAFGIFRAGNFRFLRASRASATSLPQEGVFFSATQATRAPNISTTDHPENDIYPSLGYRKISQALVTANRRCSAVVTGRYFWLPASVDGGPWNIRAGEPTVAGMLRQNQDELMVHLTVAAEKIPRGIFVGTWSPQNWFHWTIDTLPSVFLAQNLPERYDGWPLLLPATGVLKGSWREPLDLLIGSREIITLSDSHYSEVGELLWIDSPSSPGPLPLKDSGFPHFRVHAPALNAYRHHIIDKLGFREETITPSRKVFLARSQKGNRPYNQDELITIAEKNGFTAVYLEELSFKESVQLMLETKVLIGPHGAGWASALYCQSSTKAFMWTWPESRHDNWFANIGQTRNFAMTISLGVSAGPGGYELPAAEFSERLAALFNP